MYRPDRRFRRDWREMAAYGATSSLPVALAEVRSQSDLPTFAVACCRPAVCGVHDLPLANRVRVSWMEARVTKVARVSARFSKSLARRRLRVNQEKVRSTTQRRGTTMKP